MKKNIFHIVAVSKNNAIGRNNQLPWPKISQDLRHFKATTLNSTVIMGRKTYESIRKPLPNRENIVISHHDLNVPPEVIVCHSIEEAIDQASNANVFIIGGAEIFRQTIDRVDGIFLTQIDAEYPADTFYPAIPGTFEMEESKPLPKTENEPQLRLIRYKRK